MAQLMNVPYNKAMRLEQINASEFLTPYTQSANDIFETALERFALVKSVALRKKSAQYAVQVARSALYPSLMLSGGAQTNYSSVAQNSLGKISYKEQVGNNIFTTVNLGLRIPIFNAFRAKNNIKLAAIAVNNSALIEEDTQLRLRQQIEQAHLNMTNAYERSTVLTEQVAAYKISFHAAEARFNAGVGTSVDYLIAKNNLDRANINLISAQYEFVLRKKILDYYQGIMVP